ncbi:MAG TPA: FapA family protein [Spirochaetota bacterium]|nr:FapA family protein [Spirochaetota bacterium]HOM37553.1 FapA family protein [Spirochaetota bacterium]HPQ49475.1 FapA family protein [Spirochaetota bacterium]
MDIELNLDNIVEVSDYTLEGALKKAADILNTSIINIDYEIIEKGNKGFFGFGKKPFKLKVWKSGNFDFSKVDIKKEEIIEEAKIPKNGEAKIKIKREGIFLKIIPPMYGGEKVVYKDVETLLYRRGVHYFSKKKVQDIIDEAKGVWIKIGEWIPNPEYDSKITVNISPDVMEATVIMSAPIYSGRTLDPDEIIAALEAEGVKYGILYDKINEMCEEEIVNIPVVVAKGTPPVDGKNAKIVYKFNVGTDKVKPEEEEDGKVDFRKLNIVQNVVASQILAEKIPATQGKPGRTVTNKILPAKDGKDVPLKGGKNTRLSDDGLKLYATKEGHVFLSGGEIVVKEIFEVRGDVDFNIGNIDFVGTVIIHGNLNPNFKIKAAGDVRIVGVIHNAEIIAEGKVFCKGGLKGGKIKCGQSIYTKYIDNAEISAGIDVVVSEEIINSKVEAGGRIICVSGKGGVVGGEITAGKFIVAKRIGSESYTKTLIEVGTDPALRKKLAELEEIKKNLEEKFNKLIIYIGNLDEDQKKDKSKKKLLEKMLLAKEKYSVQLAKIESEIRRVSTYINNLQSEGKVSVKYTIYPGVTIKIKNAEYEIRQEFKFVTFKYSNGIIKPDKYDDLDIENTLRRESMKRG